MLNFLKSLIICIILLFSFIGVSANNSNSNNSSAIQIIEIANKKESNLNPKIDKSLKFMSTYLISGILITLGIIAIFIEIYTPGFGIFGALGSILLILFFTSHIYIGHSEFFPIILFFIGLLLLTLEIFVIPGFGFAGILGVTCTISSMFWAFGWENFHKAAQIISLSLISSIAIIVFLTLYVLPKTALFNSLSLKSVSGNIKAQQNKKNSNFNDLIGKIGMTISPLKPNGKIVIDDKIYDAISEQNFIKTNEKVVVISNSTFELKVKSFDDISSC